MRYEDFWIRSIGSFYSYKFILWGRSSRLSRCTAVVREGQVVVGCSSIRFVCREDDVKSFMDFYYCCSIVVAKSSSAAHRANRYECSLSKWRTNYICKLPLAVKVWAGAHTHRKSYPTALHTEGRSNPSNPHYLAEKSFMQKSVIFI